MVDEIAIARTLSGLANRLLVVPSDIEAVTYEPAGRLH
jgi:hypothetical protein